MWDAGALLGEHSLAPVGDKPPFGPLPSPDQPGRKGTKTKRQGGRHLLHDKSSDPCRQEPQEELLTVSRYRGCYRPCLATPRTCVVTLDPRKRQAVLRGSFARQSGLFGDYLVFQAMKRGCFVFFLNMDSEG